MFCVKGPNQHQQHSAGIDCPFEGALQHHHIEKVMGDVHHKHSLLEQCHKRRESMVRVIKSPYLNTPQLLDVGKSKVHLLVRNVFHAKARQDPLAGRLKFYLENWETQTSFQDGPPQLARMNQEERLQINSKIKEMLNKGAIQQVKSEPKEFLSNFFLVNKKDGGH